MFPREGTIVNDTFSRQLRLRRLYRCDDDRLLVVPLDHSLTDGPIVSAPGGLRRLVAQLSSGGADAIVVHKGALRGLDAKSFLGTSLIVHLSASTSHAPDPDAKYLVATVAEAVRLGADAVSVHVNVGSRDEARQVGDMAAVAEACDRWNLPLLAMMYPRGPQIDNPRDPALLAHVAVLAADLGADIVKTLYAGSPEEMRDVVNSSPIPVIVAGGPRLELADDVLDFVDQALLSGVSGFAMGRNIFQAADPAGLTRRIVDHLHAGSPAHNAVLAARDEPRRRPVLAEPMR
jgi:2-amino-4,5-dihydroxy-6-oxo-7-(phosphonooxy)heptanoate synthase